MLEDLPEDAWDRWFARRGHLDVTLLLFAAWDPVGVRDTPEAYDEYDSYATACLRFVQADDAEGLARTLAEIERSKMGFRTPAERLRETATTIVQSARASAQRWLLTEADGP
ncbi:hypothetical protein DSM112329_01932 [Paraconexibacter sp. AEG42_29]|uniref:Uncharacterized protein n=1 Tax=Paraconexibacter sp. AEG42_29 TaxID=2997339 RepID=A0AAU7ATZ8_9ACTN